MEMVVGIRLEPAGRIYHFEAGKVGDLELGEQVVVGTSRGEAIGTVVCFPPGRASGEGREEQETLKPLARKATAWDLLQQQQFRNLEPEALETCRQKATELGLTMKIVKASYNYNGGHLTFYFTTEKRVDFRQLVRELAHDLKTRVELRQVGVRDEAKLMGGVGPCGRELCCSLFISEFSPISIRMAKAQNLPLNPMEISGLCGRLLCCLSYEHEFYQAENERMPKPGQQVSTPSGPGRVVGLNILKGTVSVSLEEGTVATFPKADLEWRGR